MVKLKLKSNTQQVSTMLVNFALSYRYAVWKRTMIYSCMLIKTNTHLFIKLQNIFQQIYNMYIPNTHSTGQMTRLGK